MTSSMNLIREVMIRNFQISFVTNVKFDFKARGTQMGRPYPAQYLGRGVPGSELIGLSALFGTFDTSSTVGTSNKGL